MTTERDDFKDRLLRKQAEFENFQKRTDRERAEFVKYASAELMREVLNVVDSFELALNEAGSGDADEQRIRQGFDLIYKQLLDSLKRFGLELSMRRDIRSTRTFTRPSIQRYPMRWGTEWFLLS